MAEYEIYKEGDLEAVRKVAVFNNPESTKYTIVETLDNDDDDIKNRIEILIQIINQNPSIFDLYLELEPESPLLEEKVHVNLLKFLIRHGANIRFARIDQHNLVSVAVESEMNECQFYSLCSYLINEHKAYDLFSKHIGLDYDKSPVALELSSNLSESTQDQYHYDDWMCPVFYIFFSKRFLHFESLKIIFKIPGFDINQTLQLTKQEPNMPNELTLFQVANYKGKGVQVYKLMIEMGADYKVSFPNRRTPLTLAISNGDFESVDYYMSLGFSVVEKDSNGTAPIFYANRNLKMIKYLVSRGADICSINNDGFSLYHSSACYVELNEFVEFVMYFTTYAPALLHDNCRGGFTPLDIRKIRHPDDHRGIRCLEELVEVKGTWNHILDNLKEYAIYENGDLDAIQEIYSFTDPNCIKYTIVGTLENDADDIKRRVLMLSHIIEQNPFILDSYRQLIPKSPLLEREVHVDLLKALIAKGANIWVAGYKNHNLLSVGINSKMNDTQYHSLCSYLINDCKAYDLFSKRGSISAENRNGERWISPVISMLACIYSDYFDSLKMIFKIPKFDINQTFTINREEGDKLELTLFQIANIMILQDNVEVYKLMVESGADYKVRYAHKRTSLMVAAGNGDMRAVEYYASLGMSVHDQDLYGGTPMIHACENLKIIRFLKMLGGDLSKTDIFGRSTFHMSACQVDKESFTEFVIYFAEHAPGALNKMDRCGDTPLDIRRKEHPDDDKGIFLLELIIATIKGKQNKSTCKIL